MEGKRVYFIIFMIFGISIINPIGIDKIVIGNTNKTKAFDCLSVIMPILLNIVTKPLKADTGTRDSETTISQEVAVVSGKVASPLACKPKTIASEITNAPKNSAITESK